MSIIIGFPLTFHAFGDNLEPLDSIITCNTTATVNGQSEDSCKTNSIIRQNKSFPGHHIINWLKSLNRPRTQDEMEQWVQYKQNNLQWWQRLCCWRCCHGRGLNDDATYCPYGHILLYTLISLRPGHLVGVCTGSSMVCVCHRFVLK